MKSECEGAEYFDYESPDFTEASPETLFDSQREQEREDERGWWVWGEGVKVHRSLKTSRAVQL